MLFLGKSKLCNKFHRNVTALYVHKGGGGGSMNEIDISRYVLDVQKADKRLSIFKSKMYW